METQIPQIFTVKEFADMCKVSVPLVRKWVYEKKVFPVRLGRRVVFSEVEIKRFINENQVERG